jgi:hypothetical protein
MSLNFKTMKMIAFTQIYRYPGQFPTKYKKRIRQLVAAGSPKDAFIRAE